RWLFPQQSKPEPPNLKHLDDAVAWRLMQPEPFVPVSVLKAVYIACSGIEHHPIIEDAFVKMFTLIFALIPRDYKIDFTKLKAEYLRSQQDPRYLDKLPTVPLHDILTKPGYAMALAFLDEIDELKYNGLLYELRKTLTRNKDAAAETYRTRKPWEIDDEP